MWWSCARQYPVAGFFCADTEFLPREFPLGVQDDEVQVERRTWKSVDDSEGSSSDQWRLWPLAAGSSSCMRLRDGQHRDFPLSFRWCGFDRPQHGGLALQSLFSSAIISNQRSQTCLSTGCRAAIRRHASRIRPCWSLPISQRSSYLGESPCQIVIGRRSVATACTTSAAQSTMARQ